MEKWLRKCTGISDGGGGGDGGDDNVDDYDDDDDIGDGHNMYHSVCFSTLSQARTHKFTIYSIFDSIVWAESQTTHDEVKHHTYYVCVRVYVRCCHKTVNNTTYGGAQRL